MLLSHGTNLRLTEIDNRKVRVCRYFQNARPAPRLHDGETHRFAKCPEVAFRYLRTARACAISRLHAATSPVRLAVRARSRESSASVKSRPLLPSDSASERGVG